MELRCAGNKLHALVVDSDDIKPQGVVEIRCTSYWCGARRGRVVVLHRFNLETGQCETRQYREPPKPHNRKG